MRLARSGSLLQGRTEIALLLLLGGDPFFEVCQRLFVLLQRRLLLVQASGGFCDRFLVHHNALAQFFPALRVELDSVLGLLDLVAGSAKSLARLLQFAIEDLQLSPSLLQRFFLLGQAGLQFFARRAQPADRLGKGLLFLLQLGENPVAEVGVEDVDVGR